MDEQNSNKDVDLPVLKEEMDEPLIKYPSDYKDAIKARKIEAKERDKERKAKKYTSAFKLLVMCMVFLLVIYIMEYISAWQLKKDISGVTGNIIELLKAIILPLMGFLFARKIDD